MQQRGGAGPDGRGVPGAPTGLGASLGGPPGLGFLPGPALQLRDAISFAGRGDSDASSERSYDRLDEKVEEGRRKEAEGEREGGSVRSIVRFFPQSLLRSYGFYVAKLHR